MLLGCWWQCQEVRQWLNGELCRKDLTDRCSGSHAVKTLLSSSSWYLKGGCLVSVSCLMWSCSAFVIRTLLIPAACSPLADFAPVPPKLGHSDTFSLHCPPRESDQDSYDLILCYWPVSSSLTCINLQKINTFSNGGVTIKYLCATVFLLKQSPPRKLKMLD